MKVRISVPKAAAGSEPHPLEIVARAAEAVAKRDAEDAAKACARLAASIRPGCDVPGDLRAYADRLTAQAHASADAATEARRRADLAAPAMPAGTARRRVASAPARTAAKPAQRPRHGLCGTACSERLAEIERQRQVDMAKAAERERTAEVERHKAEAGASWSRTFSRLGWRA